MDPLPLLTELGLSQLEAEVYCHLLQSEPATAYRVAQAIGKQTANVYKAAEALARRGAVLIEEGESRVCRAVPVREFLRLTEREFLEKTRQASEALAALHRPSFDERVYRVESVAAVLGKAASMLERAEAVAVLDVFPAAWARVRPAVEAAIARGVRLYVQTYEPVELAGAASAIVAHPGRAVLDYWKSEQLNLVVDGREHLLSLLSSDLTAVYQAVWSSSLYLSCVLHGGLTSEHTVHRLLRLADADAPAPELARALREHRFFLAGEVPGQKALMERFRRPEPAEKNNRRKT